jgi:YegS/Rv2252/BmrU family lipid kinase
VSRRRYKRILIVANPAAGRRAARRVGESVAADLKRSGHRVEFSRTKAPGEARRIAEEASRCGFDLLLAVGGDGTLHEVANGAAGTPLTVGVAPAGTMNLMARVLGLPLDARRAAEYLAASRASISIRPGAAGASLFVLMAGIGFDAWVLRSLLATCRGKIAFRHYALGALAGLRSYPFPEITFETEGESVSGRFAVVGRAPLYGGFLRPTPRVGLDGSRLELCALDLRSAASCLRILPRLWTGTHLGLPGITSRWVEKVLVSSGHPDVPVQLDGELAGQLPLTIGISDRLLRLAV